MTATSSNVAVGTVKVPSRFEHFYEGKEFTADWTSFRLDSWAKILETRRSNRWRILEIGSYEGRSAIFFLKYFPNSTIVCVEPFSGNQEHLNPSSPYFVRMSAVEQRFDTNLEEFGSRVEKRRGYSTNIIPQLAYDNRRFDLIYVDGDHRAASAYNDACISWPLLVPGGLMIFDDYLWELHKPPHDRPQIGIDGFLNAMTGRYRELQREYQIIVEKF